MRTGVESADEQEREQEAEHHRQRDVRGGEHDRPHERVPEHLVAEHRAVVVEPDPLPLALDQLGEPVPLERQRDELVERVAEDRPDRDDHGQDEEVRHRRAAHPAQRERPPLPGPEGGGLGSDSRYLGGGTTAQADPRPARLTMR